MNVKKQTLWFYHNAFNLRLGWWAFPIVGGMTALVNIEHGWVETLRAGIVAGITAVFVTGVMSRVVQHFAVLDKRLWAYLGGTGLPTFNTFFWHLGGQYVNGTPELAWSVMAPTLLTFTSSLALNYGTYYFMTHSGSSFGWMMTRLRRICKVPGYNQP